MDYPKDSLAGAKATRANSKAGVTPVLILCDNSGIQSIHYSCTQITARMKLVLLVSCSVKTVYGRFIHTKKTTHESK